MEFALGFRFATELAQGLRARSAAFYREQALRELLLVFPESAEGVLGAPRVDRAGGAGEQCHLFGEPVLRARWLVELRLCSAAGGSAGA